MITWKDNRGDWELWSREVGVGESASSTMEYYLYCNDKGTKAYIPKPPGEVDIFLPPSPDDLDPDYDLDRDDDWGQYGF